MRCLKSAQILIYSYVSYVFWLIFSLYCMQLSHFETASNCPLSEELAIH